MIPFFPSLTPPMTNSLWFDVDIPCDDESDVVQLENEHQNWVRFLDSSVQSRV
jgi:Anaphase-promoting complex subunit 15